MEIKKLLYSMGEVSEMFDVKPSLIRYWESQFDVLRPKKNKKGNRLFTPEDVQMLKLIYHLVKEQGMTLEGAKRSLKQNRSSVVRDSELLERLQRVRALLVEVREDLKAGDGDLLIDDTPDERIDPVAVLPKREKPAAAAAEPEPTAEEMPQEAAEPDGSVGEKAETAAEPAGEPASEPEEMSDAGAQAEQQLPGRKRRRGRKTVDAQEKELFAFYEQSLFQSYED